MDGTKQQTIRIIYIPRYHLGELVMLKFKESETRIDDLFIVEVTALFPIQMRFIDLDIALRDGFDSVKECQEGLAEVNHRKFDESFLEDWGFVTRWKNIKQSKQRLEEFFDKSSDVKSQFHEIQNPGQDDLDELKKSEV